VLGALAGSALMACSAGASRPAPVILAFGRTGGNAAPWAVSIANDGSLTTSGPVALVHPKPGVAPAELRHIAAFLTAERFSTLPREIRCPDTLPDIAARYVTVSTGSRSRTVTERGICNTRFEKIYATIAAAVGLH
jgi:hypothetical protein